MSKEAVDGVSFEHGDERQERVWRSILVEAGQACDQQPIMDGFFYHNVSRHGSFGESISFYIAGKLADEMVPAMTIQGVFHEALAARPQIVEQMLDDLLAHYTRDPACSQMLIPLLYYKGFHGLQTYRIAHWLWRQERKILALYLQHRASVAFHVDIHPAAQLGSGIMLDHATGLVIGETAVVGDDVSILHGVTLGGSGASTGIRHPQVGRGVLISAGAKLLGNITIGEGAKIGAGSVVLDDVPAQVTVAGVPAKPVGKVPVPMPSLAMDQSIG